MKDTSMESGDRGHRDHSKGEGTKADRQGGGPGERSSLAGEQGAKADDPNNSTRSHTTPGEVHGHGTLKDGSSKDQPAEERGEGTSLHLGDDYRIDKVTGEQDETVRRQTGTANHEGGKADGAGGGKSSGGAGHGPQGNAASQASGQGNSNAKNQGSSGPDENTGGSANKNPEKGKSGGQHQHGGEFPPRTRQDPNQEGSSAGSH